MKKYKIIIPLIIFLSIGIYTSCDESKIDLQPTSPTEASFFTEEIDFERMSLGVYAKLSDIYWFNANAPIHGFWLLPGDDVTTTATDAYEVFFNLQPADGKASTYFRVAYQLINRANTFLEKIAAAQAGVYRTPNLQNIHRGEALFLRGYAYFQLWNFFGTSPLITERIVSTDKTTNPNSKDTELLDQAIKDFTEAATLLPTSWNAANRGRVTQNSANGFLGKALVYRGSYKRASADFTAAIAAFNKISGVSLVANFGDNFAANTENNAESLFEFQATQPGGGDNVWLNNDFDNNIGSTSAFWGWFDNNFALFGAPYYTATQKLRDAFEANDPRKDVTVRGSDIRKYVARNQLSQSGVGSVNNPRILRYADVLLLQAEAILESGGSTADAIALINQVRTRARNMVAGGTVPANRNVGETNRTTILQWIIDERFVELAAEEGIRFMDLKRWHTAGKLSLANWNFSAARNDVRFDVSRHLLFPIPLNEMDLNPNMRQNPGY
jgi:starch-binding outer membrane protein, SusD/RagB family